MKRENMAAYLLGELSPEKQIEMERDYFINDGSYEQLLAVEDDLAYDYVQGRLSAERQARFESTIGATERGRKNLEFARALLGVLKLYRRPSNARRYWAGGIAAALALVALPWWMAFRVSSLGAEVQRLRTELATRSAPAPAAGPVEAAFLLTPGQSRSAAESPRLEIPGLADRVRLELVLPPGSGTGDYAVAVRAVRPGSEAIEVWSRSVAASGRTAVLVIPAKLFADGEYEAAIRRLTAAEQLPAAAVYRFRIGK